MVRNQNLIHSWHSDTQHTHNISGESVNHSWRNLAICRQTDRHTHRQQLMSYRCPQQGTFQYNMQPICIAIGRLPSIRNISPADRLATGTVKNWLPQLDVGGRCSTMWSPMNSMETLVQTAPENTDTGLSDWMRVPVRSSELCSCIKDVDDKCLGLFLFAGLKIVWTLRICEFGRLERINCQH